MNLKYKNLLTILILFIPIVVMIIHYDDIDFYENHWKQDFQSMFISPKECSSCHEPQYQKWNTSLHSKSIDSGILWQLPKLKIHERENCYRCHLPNKELVANLNDYLEKFAEPGSEINIEQDAKNSNLHEIDNGFERMHNLPLSIGCVSCHLRDGTIHGPINSNPKTSSTFENLALHPIQSHEEFHDAKFCKNCHETPRSGTQVNGKYLMDVYEDWRNSTAGQNNIQCQDCHMQSREHSWKGIHNQEFLSKAIDINLKRSGSTINLNITNNHVGHKFPAYSVPRLVILIKSNNRILYTDQIGWKLDLDLKKEYSDDRINQGESLERKYDLEKFGINPKGWFENSAKIDFEIWVAPRYQYGKIFEFVLNNEPGLSKFEMANLQKALNDEKRSWYLLFRQSI